MAIDTVKLQSPYIDDSLARRIENKCIERTGLDRQTGVILYEIITGELLGSWDSRISVKVMREEWVSGGKSNIQLVACDPYLMIEASLHKIFYGHNIYGGPTDFLKSSRAFVGLIEDLLQVDLPLADIWYVRRVDWAEVFRLPFAAIQEFFEGAQTINFPRREAMKFGSNSLYFPGSSTTVKLYHKGPDFTEHDYKRMKMFFSSWRDQQFPKSSDYYANGLWVKRKLEALQRLANKRLRCEVEIHASKLDYDFGKRPLVSEVTEEYLASVYDREIGRLMREGKSEMNTVRESRAVKDRLLDVYGETEGSNLFGFFMQLAGFGEEVVKKDFWPSRKRTYYYKRKKLEQAGVSWVGSNVHVIPNEGALPRDFVPYRSDARLCVLPARTRPAFMVDREFKLAA